MVHVTKARLPHDETFFLFVGYVSAFRHGMPPHGGFAIGLQRFTARLMRKSNLREATPFPTDRNRLAP